MGNPRPIEQKAAVGRLLSLIPVEALQKKKTDKQLRLTRKLQICIRPHTYRRVICLQNKSAYFFGQGGPGEEGGGESPSQALEQFHMSRDLPRNGKRMWWVTNRI